MLFKQCDVSSILTFAATGGVIGYKHLALLILDWGFRISDWSYLQETISLIVLLIGIPAFAAPTK